MSDNICHFLPYIKDNLSIKLLYVFLTTPSVEFLLATFDHSSY